MVLCECGCGHPAPIATRSDPRRGYVKGLPHRFIAGHASKAMRADIAARMQGHAVTVETREKISASLAGRTDPPDVRAKKGARAQRGSTSPVWVGDGAAYTTVHNRARKVLPRVCAHADETCKGMLEVVLRHDVPADLLRTSTKGPRYYVGDAVADGYMRLCRSHHRRYDRS